jgi:hypothetical protein
MLRRISLAAAILLAAGASPVLAQSCDTRFTVVNQSQITINEFYFSPSSSGGWGNDRFGNGVLPGGRELAMDAGAPGAHDFKAVAANGSALELRNVDICRISRVIINPVGVFLAE